MKQRTTKTTTAPPLKLIPDLYGYYSNVDDYSSSAGLTLQKDNLTLKSQAGVSPGYKFGSIGAEYSVPMENNTLNLYGSISKESSNPFSTEIGAKYIVNIGSNKDKNKDKKKL